MLNSLLLSSQKVVKVQNLILITIATRHLCSIYKI